MRKGLTLIELVLVIIVLSIAIPSLLRMWADVGMRSVRSEAMIDAAFYAQELMEEIKSKRFDEAAASPWAAPLGPDSGESRAGTGNASFDDIDDYNGYNDSPAAGYNRCVTVDYVALSGTAWNGTCNPSLPTNCVSPACAAANRTDYKRTIVRLRRSDNVTSDVTLSTIKSGY
jgi:prepilin-type N-terminal cleavage/methylation domain-containing protein